MAKSEIDKLITQRQNASIVREVKGFFDKRHGTIKLFGSAVVALCFYAGLSIGDKVPQSPSSDPVAENTIKQKPTPPVMVAPKARFENLLAGPD